MDASAGEHLLTHARIAARQAIHLGAMRMPEVGARKNDKPHLVRESLHGRRLVDMVADLFAGAGISAERDISQIPIERIDWGQVNKPKPKGPHKRKGGHHPGQQKQPRPRPA